MSSHSVLLSTVCLRLLIVFPVNLYMICLGILHDCAGVETICLGVVHMVYLVAQIV